MDIGITPDLLSTMYNKQYELQLYMHERRGLQSPPERESRIVTHEHVLAAVYFVTCLNIEFSELYDAYKDYLNSLDTEDSELITAKRAVALEECIDCVHFALTIFIHLGLKENYARKLYHFRMGSLDSFAESVGSSMISISEVLRILPYKTWKDADSIVELTQEYESFLFSRMSLVYNNLLDFAIFDLHASYEEFTDAYIKKNALNFRRQDDKALGYLTNHV